jgi:hypothetical protein
MYIFKTEGTMLAKLLRFTILILVLVACGGGGDDVDKESIADSFVEALNLSDVGAIVSLWSENGTVSWMEDPYASGSPYITCDGTDQACWQDILDLFDSWKFENYVRKGRFLCFTVDLGEERAMILGEDKAHLRFESDKISGFSMGCP